MQPSRVMLALMVAIFVSGCQKTAYVAAPRAKLANIDKRLLEPCDDPSVIPQRLLTSPESVAYHNIDRTALRICKNRHGGLASAVSSVYANQGQ